MVDDDIDIFGADYLYPASLRKPSAREEFKRGTILNMSNEDRRQHFKREAEDRKTIRKLGTQLHKIKATDSYVESLERQVIATKTYLAIKKPDQDFDDFTNKYKELKDDKAKK